MTTPTHIVFDIGRVLIRYDREIPFRRLLPEVTEREWFLSNVCTPAWNAEQDRGRTWKEAEDLLINSYPEQAENIRAFRHHWHDMVPGPVDGCVKIMQELLEQEQDVTLLTNFAADTFSECCERFPFLQSTRGVTVSADIGLIKPDAAIFEYHAERFGLDPAATLLIDDDPVNVETALSLGWRAIRFTDPESLTAELVRIGI